MSNKIKKKVYIYIYIFKINIIILKGTIGKTKKFFFYFQSILVNNKLKMKVPTIRVCLILRGFL